MRRTGAAMGSLALALCLLLRPAVGQDCTFQNEVDPWTMYNDLNGDSTAQSADDCKANCCKDTSCQVWQWSDDPKTPPNCWSGDSNDYGDSGGVEWQGEQGKSAQAGQTTWRAVQMIILYCVVVVILFCVWHAVMRRFVMVRDEVGTAAAKQQLLAGQIQGQVYLSPAHGLGAGLAPAKKLTTCGVDRNLANVVTMAIGFLFLFTAFQTTQILASALLGNLGTISVTVLYIFFVTAGFFAPAFCRFLGTVGGLVFGGLTYCLFMASLVYISVPVVLICSAIIGFGASVLWTSQGMMISQCTNDSNKSSYFALFWGIFNLCVIPGCLVSHFLLKSKNTGAAGSESSGADIFLGEEYLNSGNGTTSTAGIKEGWNDPNSKLFIFLLFFGLVGIVVVSTLKLTPHDPATGSKAESETRPVPMQIKATIALMLKPRMITILPLFFFTGVQMTMWSSWFTRQMYASVVGLVMIGFGISEFIGCFSIGPIGDKYGRPTLLGLGSVCWVAATALLYYGNGIVHDHCQNVPCPGSSLVGCPCEMADGKPTDYTAFYVAAVLYGLADCCFQTAAGVVCAQDFVVDGRVSDAFALLKSFQSLGGVIGFGISPTSTLEVEILLTTLCGVLSLVGYAFYAGTGGSTLPRVSHNEASTSLPNNDVTASLAGAKSNAASITRESERIAMANKFSKVAQMLGAE